MHVKWCYINEMFFLIADMQNLFGDADDISSDSDGEKRRAEGRDDGGMGMVSSYS